MTKITLLGNEAAALAAKLARAQVIPAYPITPSTLIPERLSQYVADHELNAEFILVESEHSAMSACIGASAVGARAFTATASQGLALMHEMLFVAAGMRLPIVMAVGNRALSAPINIWCDHQDTISERDSGWLQFYAESNQEVLDFILLAFKVAENAEVLLPAMVCLDGFVLTHTSEIVDVPAQALVDEFLPPYNPKHARLEPKQPMTFGSLGTPEHYMEFRYGVAEAMRSAEGVIGREFQEFGKKFGRSYEKISCFGCEDADIVLLAMGSLAGTARYFAKSVAHEKPKLGVAKLNVYRPFPKRELVEKLARAKLVAVVERNVSMGFGGAVYAEVSACLAAQGTLVGDYIAGLGGRDVTTRDFNEIYAHASSALEKGALEEPVRWVSLR
jgi:pyruvate ferredoxin oxidoreductase alpha subunit